ncbi:10195_t:CDS:2 [Funneliformis mosseae]|uniref:10195_t:CDS:1 n=1 Tax=Funneliformis mosseae TaxID=27381 RepID=A0A9N8ZFV0_FUNMO|nr:10195_t:CDS:2 [Funneliformis mosseae]
MEIFQELDKKSDTLCHFITRFHDTVEYFLPLPINLSKFHNLRTLKIDEAFIFEPKFEKNGFQKLENLQMNYIDINIITRMIKNSGGNLRKILMNDFNSNNYYEETLVLIRTIYENCPLVECLSIYFTSSGDHLVEFENLLKACPKLKVLLLEVHEYVNDINKDEDKPYEEERYASSEKLSNVLLRAASINLREIGFFHYPKFSPKILGEFLEKWREDGVIEVFKHISRREVTF